MLVFAHRGYHHAVPQNTMQAFEAALRSGANAIETDVRLSRDGDAVIIHDRLTPVQHPVAELSRAEIERDVGHPVPLLEEVLDAFPNVLWDVEIKNPEAAEPAFAILKRYLGKRQLLVTSFRHDVIHACAQTLDVDCGLISFSRPRDATAMMSEWADDERVRTFAWDYGAIDELLLAEVTQAGWKNYVWGLKTRAEHERCIALGVDAIVTDYLEFVLTSVD
ncbi:MAG TPA: glycerophosphodiester phosphodiesterase [Burkholderiales bacterium]|nr:glycerophosphodiester phosphodiesterase [Burkholderiales bacterium]